MGGGAPFSQQLKAKHQSDFPKIWLQKIRYDKGHVKERGHGVQGSHISLQHTQINNKVVPKLFDRGMPRKNDRRKGKHQDGFFSLICFGKSLLLVLIIGVIFVLMWSTASMKIELEEIQAKMRDRREYNVTQGFDWVTYRYLVCLNNALPPDFLMRIGMRINNTHNSAKFGIINFVVRCGKKQTPPSRNNHVITRNKLRGKQM